MANAESIFKPTEKIIQSYRHDIKSAYDLLRPILEDAEARYHLGMATVEWAEASRDKPWEPWQSNLADLAGSLRVCVGNLSHQLEETMSSALNRLETPRPLKGACPSCGEREFVPSGLPVTNTITCSSCGVEVTVGEWLREQFNE